MQTHTHLLTHSLTHSIVFSLSLSLSHTHMRARVCKCMYAFVCVCVCVCACVCVRECEHALGSPLSGSGDTAVAMIVWRDREASNARTSGLGSKPG